MVLLLCLQIIVLFYYGSRKAGFHEDELYSYYSSNKTAGLFEMNLWCCRESSSGTGW